MSQFFTTTMQVFIVLAAAPHEPVPMNFICRVLGIKSDNEDIQAIRECGLLIQNQLQAKAPPGSFDAIERVYCHGCTREGFRVAFLDGKFHHSSYCSDDAMMLLSFAHTVSIPEVQTVVEDLVQFLLEEYEGASSYQMRQILFPHLVGLVSSKVSMRIHACMNCITMHACMQSYLHCFDVGRIP